MEVFNFLCNISNGAKKAQRSNLLGGMAKLRPFESISFSLSEIKRCEKLNTTLSGSIEASLFTSEQRRKSLRS